MAVEKKNLTSWHTLLLMEIGTHHRSRSTSCRSVALTLAGGPERGNDGEWWAGARCKRLNDERTW